MIARNGMEITCFFVNFVSSVVNSLRPPDLRVLRILAAISRFDWLRRRPASWRLCAVAFVLIPGQKNRTKSH